MQASKDENMIIRPMTVEDYASYVALHNDTYPTRTRTVDEVIQADQKRNPTLGYGRRIATIEGRIVGYAAYGQWSGETHQTWFQVNVVVAEAFRRQGIGTSLYTNLFVELAQHDPKILRADAYENLPSGLPFALCLGFKDVFREGPSHLDLGGFDVSPFLPRIQQLQSEGVEFLSYADYTKQNPSFADPLYEAYRAAWQDVPKEEDSELTRADWNEWLNEDDLDYEISTVALSGGEILGFCEVGCAPAGRPVYAGFAGVARSSRNRGIATSAYVRSISTAHAKGHPQVQTSSAIVNASMQKVYSKLGFVREPVWIQLEKRLA